MKWIIYPILILLPFLMWNCTDDLQVYSSESDDAKGVVDAFLSLSITDIVVNGEDTRAAEPSGDIETTLGKENQIDNIWVFQFDAVTGRQLISPAYYVITDQVQLENLEVLLKEGVNSTIFVVANTNSSTWAKGEGFDTLEGLKNKSLPNAEPILFNDFKPIPMSGLETTIVTGGSKVTVKVTRMYAKIKVKFEGLAEGMTPRSIEFTSIPQYCRVETLGKDTEEAAEYDNVTFVTRAFVGQEETGAEKHEYVIYVPENIQGENNNQQGSNKNEENAPENALLINLRINYKEPDMGTESVLLYKVYPGGNVYNNFNIRRNNVYRVNITIRSADQESHIPSSNCFVIEPGNGLSFEPYYRVEKGGGYNIKTYLDADDPTGKKVIEKVAILWQTKDAIGDNTNGDLVWYNNENKKIYVKTQQEGNALIAAYNADGEIIWSWHIWITDIKPDNLGSAVVYSTYDIDWENKIILSRKLGLDKYQDPNYYPRVPGYAIMPCNLGALASVPKSNSEKDYIKTFGMLYQWGRKDPFPPLIKTIFQLHPYNDTNAGIHYDNSNSENVGKTNQDDNSYLFHTILGSSVTSLANPISYSIANPTVFISGMNEIYQVEGPHNNRNNYHSQGDWIKNEAHDDNLWGGLTPSMDGSMNYLNTDGNAHMFDNYGSEKSIFDPCPSGWRVPPGNLWLGFSNSGLNPGSLANINYDDKDNTVAGMYMYMNAWRSGDKLFFPTQGPRIGDGNGIRVPQCGNYHNATADTGDRVNILHVHKASYFMIFETTNLMYYVKSVAGPIRCVRDRK